MTLLTHKDIVNKFTKYEHIKTAAHEDITPLEADNLSHLPDDEVLYVLSLNRSENVTVDILETALANASEDMVKERIKKKIGEKDD